MNHITHLLGSPIPHRNLFKWRPLKKYKVGLQKQTHEYMKIYDLWYYK